MFSWLISAIFILSHNLIKEKLLDLLYWIFKPAFTLLVCNDRKAVFMVDDYAAFFNYTPVGRASNSMIDLQLFILVGWGRSFLSVAFPTRVQVVSFLLRTFGKLLGDKGSPSSGSFLNL